MNMINATAVIYTLFLTKKLLASKSGKKTVSLGIAGVAFLVISVALQASELSKQSSPPSEPPKLPWPTTGVSFPDNGLLDISVGAENAPVVIQEISSVTCHHCSDFHKKIFPVLQKKYIDAGLVRLVLRHCPIDGVSMRVAMVLAKTPKDKRFQVVDDLWRTQPKWFPKDFSLQSMRKLSEDLSPICGIPAEKILQYMDDDSLATLVIQDRYALDHSIQIDGTPTFIINGDVLLKAATLENFEAAIEAHLKNQPKAQENHG